MKGDLLESWWKFIQQYTQTDLSPVLYRLAEELPQHASVTESDRMLQASCSGCTDKGGSKVYLPRSNKPCSTGSTHGKTGQLMLKKLPVKMPSALKNKTWQCCCALVPSG